MPAIRNLMCLALLAAAAAEDGHAPGVKALGEAQTMTLGAVSDEERARIKAEAKERKAQGKEPAMTITAPTQSHEEVDSAELPRAQRCGGCIGVAHQLRKHFEKYEALRPKSKMHKPMGEIALMEAMEAACSKKAMESYGLGAYDGDNYLNGEGIPHMDGRQGVSFGGGKWTPRMIGVCRSFTGDDYWEDGEDEFYRKFWYPISTSSRGADAFGEELCVNKMKYCTRAEFDHRMTPFLSEDEQKERDLANSKARRAAKGKTDEAKKKKKKKKKTKTKQTKKKKKAKAEL
jgi:hypothetical protein